MINLEKIENLRNIISSALTPLIDSDYVLLDVPNHRNIGDLLIWEGELNYLSSLPYKCLYSANMVTYDRARVPKNAIILLHGGGNFGDVWRGSQDFRNKIIKDFPDSKIIVLPQTVEYHSQGLIESDALLYNEHPNLILCVRDEVSFQFVNEHFNFKKVLLMPDMAFFNDFSQRISKTKKNKTLVLKRYDKELGDVTLLNKYIDQLQKEINTLEVRDWPGFYKTRIGERMVSFLNLLDYLASKYLKGTPLDFLLSDVHGVKGKNYKRNKINLGIGFINQYDKIYSTRLHGFILSVLLDKEVYIFDNSYGKNKNFYKTWLRDFENCFFLDEYYEK